VTVFTRVGNGLELGSVVTRLSISLGEAATGADLLESLRCRYPNASRLEQAVLVSLCEHVSCFALLSDGQELALLLPISGGCK
jgi:hypothetical protein